MPMCPLDDLTICLGPAGYTFKAKWEPKFKAKGPSKTDQRRVQRDQMRKMQSQLSRCR